MPCEVEMSAGLRRTDPAFPSIQRLDIQKACVDTFLSRVDLDSDGHVSVEELAKALREDADEQRRAVRMLQKDSATSGNPSQQSSETSQQNGVAPRIDAVQSAEVSDVKHVASGSSLPATALPAPPARMGSASAAGSIHEASSENSAGDDTAGASDELEGHLQRRRKLSDAKGCVFESKPDSPPQH